MSGRRLKRPKRNQYLDIEAEQAGSEVTDRDEEGLDSDSDDADDFINDDSDGGLDDPTTRRRRTRSANTHLAHNIVDRSRGEGPSNHAPTFRDAFSDASDSSSGPGPSRESFPDMDMGSGREDEVGDTLHNIIQMTVTGFEPLWRFRCTNGKERIVVEAVQSSSSCLNFSRLEDLSFKCYEHIQGWVYVAGRLRDFELCNWIASVSTYVTRNRASTHVNGPLICESVEHDADPSASCGISSINPVPFNANASISSSTHPHPNSVRSRHPKSNHKWVRIRGGIHNGEIGYALGRVVILLRSKLSSPRSSPGFNASDASTSSVSSTNSRKRKRPPARSPGNVALIITTTTTDSAALSPYRLFNPAEIRQIYGRDSVQPVRGQEHGYWFQENRNQKRDRYQHGLLVKRFKVELVQVLDEDNASAALDINTIPFELYQLFSRSGHHDIPEEIRHFPRITEWVFDEGDRVRVRVQGRGGPGSSLSATGTGSIGTVLLSRANGQLEVGFRGDENPNAASFMELQSLPWWNLVKVFEAGDYVTVTGGANKGSSGWVVSANATGSSGSHRNTHSSSSSSPAPGLSSGERGSGVVSDVGDVGQDIVEVIEKTMPGSIVSPSGEFSGLKSFSVHSNLLRRVPVPLEFTYTLNTSGPSFSSLRNSNPLTLPGPLSRHVSGAGSLPVSNLETLSACKGAKVIIMDPRCPDRGKHTTVLGVFRGYSPLTRRLWVKIAVEVSDDAGRGLVRMPARRIELDYFGVVDARTGKLLHEVYPVTQPPPQNVTTPWKDVNVTIIQAHPEKGKHAVVRDVIPVALPSTSTTTRIARSNVDKGKSKAVEYPSGLRLIVELSGFTAGRTNARINLDYYGVATEDKSTGTLKWLHEVHKLRPAQVDFRPRSVLEARRYNKRIPEGDIPLPPIALSYTVSELTRMMGQTSTTPAHMDHVSSAGTTSNVPSTSSTSSHSSSSSSSTGSSSATAPLPSLSSSSSASSSAPSSSSASSSSSSLSSPPSSTFSPSSMYSLRPLPGRSLRNLSPLFSNSPCPPSSTTSSHSGSSRSRYNLRSSPTAAAVTSPRSPNSVTNSSQSGSSPSRYNLRSSPAAVAVTPPRSPNSVTNTGASSVPSDSGAVSLGSTEPDTSDHWIFNPRLRGKKIAVIAHGGGFSNKSIFVVPKLDENEVKVIWEHYKKSRVIRPRWVYPRNPNPARYNGLSVVVGGEQQHVGKYVRRYNHTRSGMVYVSVMDHVEGRRDYPTGEVLCLEIEDLCVAFESHPDRELNEDLMVDQRSPFHRTHRSD
ncbi:hypothetical protein D9758_011979 [Tetrapyrgos nigripes]|uniref:Uncharacterized protein n=1 Tax=Tetrapyrgos nigripes TaxID=182062 RepID=A0A8H5D304_9AGAR|nr:hypothetical protein D9758_011979 [Tetrapyrgos nigripes]